MHTPVPDDGDRLDEFLREALTSVGRLERRRAAAQYVRGLISDVARKTVSSLAAGLPQGKSQAMHHVLAHSPWEGNEVFRRVAETLMPEIEPEPAWVVREVAFPKRGHNSVGVARQVVRPAGRADNVQVGISLHHIGARGDLTLGWRLYLPSGWAADPERRRRAAIPEHVAFRSKWQLMLDLIDEARRWDVRRAVVVADAEIEDYPAFVSSLEERGVPYILRVPPEIVEHAAPAGEWRLVRWRERDPAWKQSFFWAGRTRVAEPLRRGSKEVWLLAERLQEPDATTDFFVGDLPAHYPVARLARLIKARTRAEAHVRTAGSRLGLAHYEGRNWLGWHHHLALVAVAHGYLTFRRVRAEADWLVSVDGRDAD